MTIYTKRGDGGKTDLFDPKTAEKKEVSKASQRLTLIGSIDELVCHLGIVKSILGEKRDRDFVGRVQKDLFSINSIIAGFSGIKFSKAKINYLEREIDFLEDGLPKLKEFVIPGENRKSSQIHLARSVARRVERILVSFLGKDLRKKAIKSGGNILVFINRLSDYLFVLARKYTF